MRWVWPIVLSACAQHGVAPEPSTDPEPAKEEEAPRGHGGRCDHEPPTWLTVDVDPSLPPTPSAPTGPGIAAADREPRKHHEQWSSLVSDGDTDFPEVPPTGCRSQHLLESDERPVATILYMRDAASFTERRDYGTDGRVDETRTWTRDAAGAVIGMKLARPKRFVCGKRVPARHEKHDFVYDRFGLLIRTDIDTDGNGYVDMYADWRAIRYDRDGLPIMVVQFDGSGSRRLVHRFTWGADQRLTERLVQDDAGKLLEAERYDYNAHGQRRWAAEFREGQGWRTSRLRYGDSGDVVAIETDVDADCFVDERTALQYDDRGELVRSTTRVDDEVQVEDAYKYDDAGRLRHFTRARGKVLNDEFAEHEYDDAGRPTSMRLRKVLGRHGAPGMQIVEDSRRTRYDASGRVVEQRHMWGTFGADETVRFAHECRRAYRRFPELDPRDDPEFASYCFKDFE
jgi:hypothetical protein